MKQAITVGGGRIVGHVSVDGGALRGEGGPLRPHLVVPLTITMQNRPADSMVAVTALDAWLCPDENAFVPNALCAPVTVSLVPGFPARSLPQGSVDHTIQFRFALTPMEVEHLEYLRQKAGSDAFTVYLGLDATVAGLKTFNQVLPGAAPEATPWDLNLGLFSQVLPFWNCQIQPARVQIEQSAWVRAILPGLGYDRVRLIEMTFPPSLPNHRGAAAQFDKARRALDERRYDDCIQECRGLLNMWEKEYGANATLRLADVVSKERGWRKDGSRRVLLDSLWKQVGDVANAPHHPERDSGAEAFDGRDARLLLLLTAALSEYVEPR